MNLFELALVVSVLAGTATGVAIGSQHGWVWGVVGAPLGLAGGLAVYAFLMLMVAGVFRLLSGSEKEPPRPD